MPMYVRGSHSCLLHHIQQLLEFLDIQGNPGGFSNCSCSSTGPCPSSSSSSSPRFQRLWQQHQTQHGWKPKQGRKWQFWDSSDTCSTQSAAAGSCRGRTRASRSQHGAIGLGFKGEADQGAERQGLQHRPGSMCPCVTLANPVALCAAANDCCCCCCCR